MEAEAREAFLAQQDILKWLISRCEDQMVRAWLYMQLQTMQQLGEPLGKDGAVWSERGAGFTSLVQQLVRGYKDEFFLLNHADEFGETVYNLIVAMYGEPFYPSDEES